MKKIIAALLLISLVFSIGCNQKQERNKGREKTEQVEITYAYQDRVADLASIVAFQKGMFEKAGLNVNPKVFSSGPLTLEALLYGNAQIATMGDTTSVIFTSKNPDKFQIIASHGGGEKRHRIIVKKDSGIAKPEDLKGKKIGIKKGTSTYGGFVLFADRHGLDLQEEMIDLKAPDQLTALASGEIDVLVASEPTPSLAEANGAGVAFMALEGLGNNFPILLVANKEFLEQHPEQAQKFIDVLKEATVYIKNNPEEAAKIQAGILGLDEKVILNAMNNHYYELNLSEDTLSSLEFMAEFLKKQGKIESSPDFNKVINRNFVK